MKTKTFLLSLSIFFTIIISTSTLWAKPDFVGNIIGTYIPDNFDQYWEQVTPENASKWGVVENNRDKYNWAMVDRIYKYAKDRGMPFKFHTLVWGRQDPGWMKNLSSKDQRDEIEEWIRDVAKRYKPEYIDVVNEPMNAKPSYIGALGGSGKSGWDWVITSFELARKYFPNSQLHLNEYSLINNSGKVDKYLKIVNALKNKGLIDGVGIQCHQYYVDNTAASTLTKNLNKLASAGLPIYITELDIKGDDKTQLKRYQNAFPAFYNHPQVKGITLWGYILGQTWLETTGLVHSGSKGAKERPSMKWLKSYLKQGNKTPVITQAPRSSTTPKKDCSLKGDGNKDNKVNIIDALLAAQIYVRILSPQMVTNSKCLDVDCNGQINIVDALLIAQYYVGSKKSLQC